MESIKEFPRGIRPLAQSSRRTAAGVRQPLKATSVKLQATSFKLQATSFKRQVKLQAASVECDPNRQAPSMAFRGDLSGDRGSLYSHKVLLVQKRLPGL